MERPLKKVKTERREYTTSNLKSDSDDPANEDDSIQVTSPPPVTLQRDDNSHAPPDDSAVQVVGTLNSQSLPHMRPHCTKHAFWDGLLGLYGDAFDDDSKKKTRDNLKFCALCFCYVCDKPAKDCRIWDRSIAHCHATDRGPNADIWKSRRQAVRRQAVKERAQGTVQQPVATRTATAPATNAEYDVARNDSWRSPNRDLSGYYFERYSTQQLPSHTEDFAGQFFGGGGRGGPASKTVLQVLLLRVFVLVAEGCVEKKVDPNVGPEFYHNNVFSVEIVPGYKLEYLFDSRQKAMDKMKNMIKRFPLDNLVRSGLEIPINGVDATCAWKIAIRGIQDWKPKHPDRVSGLSIARDSVCVTHEKIVQGSKTVNVRHQELVGMKRHQTLINEFFGSSREHHFRSHENANVLTSSMLQYLVKVRGLYIDFKCKLGRRSTPDEIRQAGNELNDLCGFYPKPPIWRDKRRWDPLLA
jgi:hypothetical protein